MLNGPVLALDNDQGINALVRYQLLGMPMDLFIVNNRTGKLATLTLVIRSPVKTGSA